MRSHISDTPDKDAGEYITAQLRTHAHEHILLLLSGGSALRILKYLNTEKISSNVTITMADEHFTRDPHGNNFLQLQETEFYAQAKAQGAHFLESVPGEFEKHHEFAERMELLFESYIAKHPKRFSIGIFGIGEDGHTAGIFPAPKEEFEHIYHTDEFYIHVTQSRHPYPQRTSVTPTFIEELLDEIVLFAVGSNKCENILDYMYNRTFEQHEIPALIPASHPHSMLFTDCPTLTPQPQIDFR